MTDQTQQYFVVDAFTNRPFSGNPAAVVPLREWPSDEWLQNVAMEMNLSETAFLSPNADGYELRWFTPEVEVDLCGHATIAASAVLAELGQLADGTHVRFATRSGTLITVRKGLQFQLDFPSLPATVCEPPPGLLEALNVDARCVARSRFDLLVELAAEEEVRRATPNFKQLAAIECRGVIVTSASDDPQFDFVSRFFAPAVGIDEDPVCGSAHCVLAPFWHKRLNKPAMIGHQISARGGVIYVEPREDRVLLGGQGVIVARGELLVD